MTRLLSWQKYLTKLTRFPDWLPAILFITISVLIISLQGNVVHPYTVPDSKTVVASVVDWHGSIRLRRGNEQAIPISSGELLHRNVDVLEVPPSSGGSEHWAHLKFKGSRYLFQAGTDSSPTKYRVPCGYSGGTMVLGLRQNGRNGVCDKITIGVKGWQSSNSILNLAQKSKQRSSAKGKLTAQQDPTELNIIPSNRLTLVYVQDFNGSTAVNVLTGSVTIKSAAGRTIVNSGIRYVDNGDGRRGDLVPVPKELYSARPIEIFLTPDTWSEDIRADIQTFQEAVKRQQAAPPETTNNDPRYIPEPTKSPAPSSPPPSEGYFLPSPTPSSSPSPAPTIY